jgi:hypothetical protein
MALLDILYRIDIALSGMHCLHSRYTYLQDSKSRKGCCCLSTTFF